MKDHFILVLIRSNLSIFFLVLLIETSFLIPADCPRKPTLSGQHLSQAWSLPDACQFRPTPSSFALTPLGAPERGNPILLIPIPHSSSWTMTAIEPCLHLRPFYQPVPLSLGESHRRKLIRLLYVHPTLNPVAAHDLPKLLLKYSQRHAQPCPAAGVSVCSF